LSSRIDTFSTVSTEWLIVEAELLCLPAISSGLFSVHRRFLFADFAESLQSIFLSKPDIKSLAEFGRICRLAAWIRLSNLNWPIVSW